MKIVFMVLLSVAVLPAQAAQWLPDPQRVAQAIGAQPEVQAARARVDAARAQARARAVGPHEVTASAIVQQRNIDEAGGGRDYREYELQVGRAFRLPGKVALDRSIGEQGVLAAELRLDDARHQAARRLLDDWMAWLRADAQRREMDGQLEALRREHAALARRVQVGDAAQKDLDLLGVDLAQTEAQHLAASTAVDVARQALTTDFPSLSLPERVPEVTVPQQLTESAEVWARRIVERSHEVAALEADAAQADALAARSRADRFADPTIGLRLMNDRGGAERALGVVVSVPIGGRYRSAAAAGDGATAAALHGDAAAMQRDIRREAGTSVETAQARYSQWLAQRRALDASSAANRRVHRGWQLGELSLSDWLMAERMQRQIALNEAEARIAAEQARLRVLVDSHEIWHEE